ncbi:MAG: chemotaxis protein CheB [Planctomycetota bacterium]
MVDGARVLVVGKDVHVRQALAAALAALPGVEVVGSATNARTGMAKAEMYRPDAFVVDVDSETAAEDLEAVRQDLHQRRVVLVSADVGKAATEGLVDVVARPPLQAGAVLDEFLDEVHRRVRGEGGRRPRHARSEPAAPVAARPLPPKPPPPCRRGPRLRPKVVGIGISTGGPPALNAMLPCLPASFPLPILVVQHMPPTFTASLADSLNRVCKLRVREAKAGDPLSAGEILIAPGGRHMRVATSESGNVVRLTDDPPECSCRPSVDYLFRSLGEVYGGHTLAVVMTGMGEDGLASCRQLAGLGATIYAQDKETSTVFGMPRGLVEEGLADAVLPLDQIADAILAKAMTVGL